SFFIMLLFFGFGLFETFFQIAQRLKAMAFVFSNPTFVDLMQRHRIEIMQLLAPTPYDRDEVCFLQQRQMLGHRLPCHVQVFAQFAQRLPILLAQLVEQLSATGVGQRFKDCIHQAALCNQMVACQAARVRETISTFMPPAFLFCRKASLWNWPTVSGSSEGMN